MLDVISSTRLFTNLGVTCLINYRHLSSQNYEHMEHTYRRSLVIQIEEVLVQSITIQLHSHNLFCCGVGYTQGFLEAF
jgi:hypothetical protein